MVVIIYPLEASYDRAVVEGNSACSSSSSCCVICFSLTVNSLIGITTCPLACVCGSIPYIASNYVVFGKMNSDLGYLGILFSPILRFTICCQRIGHKDDKVYNRTALHGAALYGNIWSVYILTKFCCANYNEKDSLGKTALDLALDINDPDLNVIHVIDSDTGIKYYNSYFASIQGRKKAAEYFLNLGAKPSRQDNLSPSRQSIRALDGHQQDDESQTSILSRQDNPSASRPAIQVLHEHQELPQYDESQTSLSISSAEIVDNSSANYLR